jgi:hypothetical protein
MAKLSDSKIFYLQAFTILALVCLPGNIFTAVLLYLQHFSTTTTTTASSTTTTTTTTTITDNVTFEGSLTLNDEETSESDISSTNLSFVDKSSNLLSADLEEKVSTETDTISELEGFRKNFSSISQTQEQTTDDNSPIEKAKLKNGKFKFKFSILFVYFLKTNVIRKIFRSDWFMKLDYKKFDYQA